jgi:Protein of unknown function (DUF2752)
LITWASHTYRLIHLRIVFIVGIFAVAPFWAQHRFGICIFHKMTGLECPLCGMTRAFYAISHGHFAQAIHFNAFSLALYFLLVGLLLRDSLQLLAGIRIPIPALLRRQEPSVYLFLSFFVATAYVIARNIGVLP